MCINQFITNMLSALEESKVKEIINWYKQVLENNKDIGETDEIISIKELIEALQGASEIYQVSDSDSMRDKWIELSTAGKQPVDGSILIRDNFTPFQYWLWDSTEANKGVYSGRDVLSVASDGESLENSSKIFRGKQTADYVAIKVGAANSEIVDQETVIDETVIQPSNTELGHIFLNEDFIASANNDFYFFNFSKNLKISASVDNSAYKRSVYFFDENFDYTGNKIDDFLNGGSITDSKLLDFNSYGSLGVHIGFHSAANNPAIVEVTEVDITSTSKVKKELLPPTTSEVVEGSKSLIESSAVFTVKKTLEDEITDVKDELEEKITEEFNSIVEEETITEETLIQASDTRLGFFYFDGNFVASGGNDFYFFEFNKDLKISASTDNSAYKHSLYFFDESFVDTENTVDDFLNGGSITEDKLLDFSTYGSLGTYVGFHSNSNNRPIVAVKEIVTTVTKKIKSELLPETTPIEDTDLAVLKFSPKVDLVANTFDDDITFYTAKNGTSDYSEVVTDRKIQILTTLGDDGRGYEFRYGFNIESTYASGSINRSLVVAIEGYITATNLQELAFREGTATYYYPVAEDLVDGERTYFKKLLYVDSNELMSAAKKQWYLRAINVSSEVVATLDLELINYSVFERNNYYNEEDYFNHLETSVPKTLSMLKKYSGKKLVTLGHSIVNQNTWQPILASLLGLEYNFLETFNETTPLSLGGAAIRAVHSNTTEWDYTTDSSSANGKKNTSFWYRSRYVKQYNPDIIVIMSATNDSSNPGTVGTSADLPYLEEEEKLSSDPEAPTFYSSLKGLFQKLITDNPTALVVYCSLARNWYADPANNIGEITGNRYDLFLAEKSCANEYGAIFIDLLNDAGLAPYNNHLNYKADSPDATWIANGTARVHPNQTGGKLIANCIAKKL